MTKYLSYSIIAFLLLSCVACGHYSEEVEVKLQRAASLLEEKPDSALIILNTINDVGDLVSRQKADYALLMTQTLDKNVMPLSDSLVEVAYNYYSDNKEDVEKRVKVYFYTGRVYEEAGENDKAMKAYLEAETYSSQLNNPSLKGLLNFWMAGLLVKQDFHDDAIRRCRQSLVYFSDTKQFKNKEYALQRMAYSYLRLKQRDSALVYFDEAHLIAEQINDTLGLAATYFMMGETSFYEGDFLKTKNYLNQSIRIMEDTLRMPYIFNMMSDMYQLMGKLDSSVYYANKAFDWAVISNNESVLQDCYLRLYALAKMNARPLDAYRAIERYIAIKDSLTEVQNLHNALEVEKKYQHDLLLVENQKLALQKRISTFVTTVSVLAFLSAVLIFLLYRSAQRRIVLELKEKESREQQKLLESEIALIEAHNKILKLNEFVLKRLDVSKEIITIGRTFSDDYERTHKELQGIIAKLTFNAKDREELKRNINDAYDGFVDRLVQNFPKLTEYDIQLCCMIRAGFENDIIMSVLNITYESLYTTRYRLREKLDLVKTNIQLAPFLSGI